jgi:glycosyltransferase involved in cell wall biosynthesis
VGVGDDGEELYVEFVGKYGLDPVIDFIKDAKQVAEILEAFRWRSDCFINPYSEGWGLLLLGSRFF